MNIGHFSDEMWAYVYMANIMNGAAASGLTTSGVTQPDFATLLNWAAGEV